MSCWRELRRPAVPALLLAGCLAAHASDKAGKSPDQELPPHITREQAQRKIFSLLCLR